MDGGGSIIAVISVDSKAERTRAEEEDDDDETTRQRTEIELSE